MMGKATVSIRSLNFIPGSFSFQSQRILSHKEKVNCKGLVPLDDIRTTYNQLIHVNLITLSLKVTPTRDIFVWFLFCLLTNAHWHCNINTFFYTKIKRTVHGGTNSCFQYATQLQAEYVSRQTYYFNQKKKKKARSKNESLYKFWAVVSQVLWLDG